MSQSATTHNKGSTYGLLVSHSFPVQCCFLACKPHEPSSISFSTLVSTAMIIWFMPSAFQCTIHQIIFPDTHLTKFITLRDRPLLQTCFLVILQSVQHHHMLIRLKLQEYQGILRCHACNWVWYTLPVLLPLTENVASSPHNICLHLVMS